jgi:DNA-binding NarL/FixJ family response regulator
MPCQILLVNDYPLFRAGMKALLEKKQEYEVVAEAGDGSEAIEHASRLLPDVILLDLAVDRLTLIDTLKTLSISSPNSKVLILSMYTDSNFVMQCLQLGAHGYLLRSTSVLELYLALDALRQEGQYLSSVVVPLVVNQAIRHRHEPNLKAPSQVLTARQLEVLRLIARGETTRNIAIGLGLSVKTIEAHRSQMMHRLRIHDIAGLVMFAVRKGIVQLND